MLYKYIIDFFEKFRCKFKDDDVVIVNVFFDSSTLQIKLNWLINLMNVISITIHTINWKTYQIEVISSKEIHPTPFIVHCACGAESTELLAVSLTQHSAVFHTGLKGLTKTLSYTTKLPKVLPPESTNLPVKVQIDRRHIIIEAIEYHKRQNGWNRSECLWSLTWKQSHSQTLKRNMGNRMWIGLLCGLISQKICPDYKSIGKEKTFALDFCQNVLYTVIPELRKVKPRERDKAYKLNVGERYFVVRSYKNATSKYKCTDRFQSLSIRLASLLASSIFCKEDICYVWNTF